MNEQLKFTIWMKKNLDLSEYTIGRYSKAIITISDDLSNYTNRLVEIYSINEAQEVEKLLDEYLTIDDLSKKNKKGNRMYSNSLKRYMEYLEDGNITPSKRADSKGTIVYAKKKKGTPRNESGKEVWDRDDGVKNRVLENSQYTCEVDESHKLFISKATLEY